MWVRSATTIEDADAIAQELRSAVAEEAAPRIGVFIEAVGDFLQSAAETSLTELVKAVNRSDHFLLAEGEQSSWSANWGMMADIKVGRRGVLLQPDNTDGDMILRTPLPRAARSEFPPGRAVYVARGAFERVQLPLP